MRVCAVNGMLTMPEPSSSRPRMPKRSFASTTTLRPSGVSSVRLASCAASARSCSAAPSTGMNSAACRLPSVMVPVLSSKSTSTSPAASTARPLMASTFARFRRLMPAMPIADSSAPMVVGARHTNSATSEVMVVGFAMPSWLALKPLNANSDTDTIRNTMVSATSSISSAISFGVFLRVADSTMAIIWSRKLWPASAVTRTTSQSESTVVPPVTAERSPPDSRMTGADSPVMALSSTDAAPMTISPSAGICSPAAT